MKTIEDILDTLAHEFIHAYQEERGCLKASAESTTWQNVNMHDVDYSIQPWEIEARELSSFMIDKFQRNDNLSIKEAKMMQGYGLARAKEILEDIKNAQNVIATAEAAFNPKPAAPEQSDDLTREEKLNIARAEASARAEAERSQRLEEKKAAYARAEADKAMRLREEKAIMENNKNSNNNAWGVILIVSAIIMVLVGAG